ncbi:MAG: hypothetical protein K8R68_03915 [Bacteroidales bacterium]|nr:hypothetical protein [Bacteroidales bacterium]
MKKTLLILSVFIMVICACKKETDKHELRVKSDFLVPVEITVGPNSYGTINTGTTTAYKEIPQGSHNITGTMQDTIPAFQGSLTIQGDGEHKWTMAIGSLGATTLTED